MVCYQVTKPGEEQEQEEEEEEQEEEEDVEKLPLREEAQV
jgi:hypothetical protein